MHGPPGYPPPTLVRKRSWFASARVLILLLVAAVVLGTCTLGRVFAPEAEPAAPAPVEPAAEVDKPAAELPDSDQLIVERPADTAAAQPSPDARQPNRWYYVPQLAEGPAAIYSKTGGQWNYAFSCALGKKTIEIIAIGAGAPGTFNKQSIAIGKVRLMMDATYAPDAGGTITTVLPAAHPFFNSFVDKAEMEIHLLADRKTIIPVGPDLVRLIQDCRSTA